VTYEVPQFAAAYLKHIPNYTVLVG